MLRLQLQMSKKRTGTAYNVNCQQVLQVVIGAAEEKQSII